MVTLIGFIAGAVLATFHMPFWWEAPSLGTVTLGDRFGWPAATGIQLLVFAMIALGAWQIERHSGPPRITKPERRRLRLSLLRGPWPLMAGAVGLAVLNAVTLLLAGHPWTITWAFSLWGAKLLQSMGYDLSQATFWSGPFQQQALAASVFADTVSVMDVGVVLGALLAAALAGRFAPSFRIRPRLLAVSLVGGLLLGYGARIAFGCNIGAYFSGVASTSLHGWLWLLGALLGTPIGVRLRAHLRHD